MKKIIRSIAVISAFCASTLAMDESMCLDRTNYPFSSLNIPFEINCSITQRLDGSSAVAFSAVSRQAQALVATRGHLKLKRGIDPTSIISLFRGMKKITSLDLSSLGNFMDDVKFVALAVFCPNLRDVSISSSEITKVTVNALVDSCSNLTSISLKNCSLITDEDVDALAGYYKGNLRSIDLGGCDQITNKSLFSLANNCQKLLSLELERCCLFNDEGLMQIGERCTDIKFINLKACHSITEMGLIVLLRDELSIAYS
jgi:Leucine Rich repeat